MNLATNFAFYGAIALYAAAALAALDYLRRMEDRRLTAAHRLMIAGALFLLATFVLRAVRWRLVPFTTLTDSLNLLLLLSTLVVAIVVRPEGRRSLLALYLPPLAGVGLINAATAHLYLHEKPLALHGTLLTVHVGLAFLAYSLFFVASLTSLGYVYQVRRLKRHNTTGLFQRLPSLECLDGLLFRLVSVGYPLFAVTLVLGLFWAYIDRELLGDRWWLAPKVLLALIMASFYSITFHSRRLGWLRGPKLAYFVFIGFTSLLTLYLMLGITQLNNHRFWGFRT